MALAAAHEVQSGHIYVLRARVVLARGRQRAAQDEKSVGGAGYRSLCLLHAKQALYHLSYTAAHITMRGCSP